MKPDSEPDETTPALSDIEQGGRKKKVTFSALPGYNAREQRRQKIVKGIKRQQEIDDCKYKCITGICLICMIILIIGCFNIICKYYLDTLEHREDIDNKIVIVSEKWIDYSTPESHEQVHLEGRLIQHRAVVMGADGEQVNCTNSNPCKEWTCSYVIEHFHKTPDECEYNDYLVPIAVTNILMLVCCICNLLFN